MFLRLRLCFKEEARAKSANPKDSIHFFKTHIILQVIEFMEIIWHKMMFKSSKINRL